jgi:plastocyanin
MDDRPLNSGGPQPRHRSPWRSVAVVALLTLSLALLIVVGAAALTFSDVPADHPYSQAIQTLSDQGIIGGFPDGTFRPDSPVIRQQFAKMIVLTLGLPVSESDVVPFDDVQIGGFPDPFYPDNYIAVAAANGITVGTGPGKFSPGARILRAQVVTMIVRGAQNVLPSGTLATPPAGYTGSLPNFSDIHSPNMRVAEFNGLLAGLVGFGPAWDPWKPASRGEVAQMLANLLALVPPSGSTTTLSGSTTTMPPSTTTTLPSTTTTVPHTPTTIPVSIKNLAFNPATVTIHVGDSVIWTNNDGFAHTVTADGGTFGSPNLPAGATFSHTFNSAGEFAYHCAIHLSMKGKVVVQ